MRLAIATLGIAIMLSVVSAYYSVMGLTAIFAGAFWSIVVMGGALEIAKVITAIWLHKNWKRSPLNYKLYLVPAMVVLMVLTSVGVFGYLSKSHLDQNIPSGDIQEQVTIFDDKIKTQKDNIDAARKALSQMDSAVDQTMARSSDSNGATAAVAIRRSQSKERNRLQADISSAQSEIVKLQEQRAPIASKARIAEADVGPIRYVAALVYGDTTDQNVLEKAVRWMIILIVSVFDPLAIVLILAGARQLEWYKEDKTKVIEEESYKIEELPVPPTATFFTGQHSIGEPTTQVFHEETPEEEPVEEQIDFQTMFEAVKEEYEKSLEVSNANLFRNMSLTGQVEQLQNQVRQLESQNSYLIDQIHSSLSEQPVDDIDVHITSPEPVLDIDALPKQIDENKTLNQTVDNSVKEMNDDIDAVLKTVEFPHPVEAAPAPVKYTPPQPMEAKPASSQVVMPDLSAKPDVIPPDNQAGFGTSFPQNPDKGDMFLRVDMKPSRQYKFNGYNWMEMPKNDSYDYAFDEEYIKHLIKMVESGEYAIDDLSETEKEQMERFLTGNE